MGTFAWNVPLVSLIFLKRAPVFPILLFSSISLHWSLRKAFLSLLAILWNSAFNGYIFHFLLCFFFFSTAICKASSDNDFAFFVFLFLGDGSFKYDLNQIPYDHTVEVRNRFKGLDLIDKCLKNYRWGFVTLYRRQWSRKRNAKRQNDCLRKL